METFYCSIACQRKHWKEGHKHKCVKAEKPSASSVAAAPRRGGRMLSPPRAR
jgi:hypothetical protein